MQRNTQKTVFYQIFIVSIILFTTVLISNKSTISAVQPTVVDSFKTQDYENETLLSHTMNVRIQTDNSIKITSTFVLNNTDSVQQDYFFLYINRSIVSVFCSDPIGPLEFNWQVNPQVGNYINITLRYPLLPSEIYVFSVSYYIEDIIYSVDGLVKFYGLDYQVIHPRNTDTFNLEICLPFGAGLLTITPPDPVFPEADKVSVENDITKIFWQSSNRVLNESDIYLIRFEYFEEDTPHRSPLAPLYYVLAVMSGLAAGIAGVYLYYMLKRKPAETQLVTALLSDTEQEVIKAINADGGVSTQRRICDTTGYSKSKVSQILAKLEEKKVLKRERWGRTNKVTITSESFKKISSEP
jgi:uncharacterized membrane protein